MLGHGSRFARRLAASQKFARHFASGGKYDPNVVNLCLNPPAGKMVPSVPILIGLGCFLLGTPLIAMHFDNKRFLAELERRKQPGVRY
ncbi:hypothetical protein BgAZ_102150 [Babesia gibsoni]|uniref:Uncharacterized protein n=1 Tax=Babesia gibsoni TaxID=33632 RepID=A0AAD8PFD5_BABGI|nr:hypothetical protein BgAZ_102150 [Babesia gibsoni]